MAYIRSSYISHSRNDHVVDRDFMHNKHQICIWWHHHLVSFSSTCHSSGKVSQKQFIVELHVQSYVGRMVGSRQPGLSRGD